MRWPYGSSPLQSPLALKTEASLLSAHGECWSVRPAISSLAGFQVALSELFLSIFPASLFAVLSAHAKRIMLYSEPLVTPGEIVRFRPLPCPADVSKPWAVGALCRGPCEVGVHQDGAPQARSVHPRLPSSWPAISKLFSCFSVRSVILPRRIHSMYGDPRRDLFWLQWNRQIY